jgi:hypothetical protein
MASQRGFSLLSAIPALPAISPFPLPCLSSRLLSSFLPPKLRKTPNPRPKITLRNLRRRNWSQAFLCTANSKAFITVANCTKLLQSNEASHRSELSQTELNSTPTQEHSADKDQRRKSLYIYLFIYLLFKKNLCVCSQGFYLFISNLWYQKFGKFFQQNSKTSRICTRKNQCFTRISQLFCPKKTINIPKKHSDFLFFINKLRPF